MKKTILKYGLYASVVMIVLPLIGWLSTSGETDYKFGEIIGYTTMFLAMIFVFLGIRDYRNRVNGGQLKFMEAFKLGVMIAIIPAFAFGLIDQVYVNFINPDFYDEYYAHSLDQMRAEMDGEEFEQAAAKDGATKRDVFQSGTSVSSYVRNSVFSWVYCNSNIRFDFETK